MFGVPEAPAPTIVQVSTATAGSCSQHEDYGSDLARKIPNLPLIRIMAGSESRYQDFLDALGQDRLRRDLTHVAAKDARTLEIGGRAYVNLASNDYLALRFHEALAGRAGDWARCFGAGSGASRLVTGNLDLFAGIEHKVAALKQKPEALIMASGFQANASVLQALFDRRALGKAGTRPLSTPSGRIACGGS